MGQNSRKPYELSNKLKESFLENRTVTRYQVNCNNIYQYQEREIIDTIQQFARDAGCYNLPNEI